VPKRENSSLILQNLKKRELRLLGDPVVSMAEAERRLTQAESPVVTASTPDSYHDSRQDSNMAVEQLSTPAVTKLRPRERVARSALIIRLNPALHRELEEVARFNRLTMNDIAIEAIEMHLRNFPHPGDEIR
jgi:hypothetical protein